jgi:hypothetical protein
MTDEPQEAENREDRDRERSDEAHWRVAEEGAEDEPTQKTERGSRDSGSEARPA